MRIRWALILLLVTSLLRSATAATPAEINAAVAKGAAFLRGQSTASLGGGDSLGAIALLKAGIPADDPGVQTVVGKVLQRCSTGVYVPGVTNTEAIYTAGVDATLLMEANAEKHRSQIQLIANYLLEHQLENGGWNYPDIRERPNSIGDTSVTQYACLGLWAADRAKIAIPKEAWVKVLNWHARVQSNDGGFAYAPGFNGGDGEGRPTLNMTVNGVGSMQLAFMHLAPGFLPLQETAPRNESGEPARFGVLEKLEISGEQQQARVAADASRIPPEAVPAIRRAYQWVTVRYRVENSESNFKLYYYYSLERMASLINAPMIGSHDWYNECAEALLRTQAADGSWKMSTYNGADIDTAFAVLFLARATGKLLQRVRAIEGAGDGLMVGGRGLPSDLTKLDLNSRMNPGGGAPTDQPLDALLRSLQNPGEINLEDVQEQIVEQVQLGNREELVGKADQLVGLLQHASAEVRQTAVWAMGRSDRLDLAEHLIRALSDPDLGVMIEAQNALCWLSRRPNGFGLPQDPIATLPPNATDAQKKTAITAWHKSAMLAWGEWFLQNRPFKDRGDEYESTLRQQLQKLKNSN